MKKIIDIVNEDFKLKKKANIIKNVKISTKEELYDYIVNTYNLKSIDDMFDPSLCPDKLELADIEISDTFDTTELFSEMLFKHIDISSWRISEIGNKMFYYCEKLFELTIPDNVVKIGDNAFESCRSLRTLYFPKSVTQFGRSPFIFCGELYDIVTSKGNKSDLVKNNKWIASRSDYVSEK